MKSKDESIYGYIIRLVSVALVKTTKIKMKNLYVFCIINKDSVISITESFCVYRYNKNTVG